MLVYSHFLLNLFAPGTFIQKHNFSSKKQYYFYSLQYLAEISYYTLFFDTFKPSIRI